MEHRETNGVVTDLLLLNYLLTLKPGILFTRDIWVICNALALTAEIGNLRNFGFGPFFPKKIEFFTDPQITQIVQSEQDPGA